MLKIRPFALTMLALLLIVAPAIAQQEAPTEYPTLTALQAAEIPARDRVALAQAINGVGEIPPPPTSAPVRQVGDRAIFHVTDTSNDRTFEVPSILQAVGDHIYLWVEDGVSINPADLNALAAAFDTYIYPETRALWGSEDNPGIDGDPRVYGLFAHNLGGGTAAYFISEHTFPVEAVPTSNEHEMFFFNLDTLNLPLDLPALESIVAHEFQHMIRENIQSNEEYWLNEGFSEFTQHYLYDLPVWEAMSFLSNPGTQLNTWAEDYGGRSQHYGAAMLFVTYFHDRYGLEALQTLNTDPSSNALGAVDTVLRDLGEPGVDEMFADWVLANALFDPAIEDGRYGYASINPNVIAAAPLATITDYPFYHAGQVNQYATNYFVMSNIRDYRLMTVEVEAPQTVRLVNTDAASGQHMWYSNKNDVSDSTLTRAFDLSGVASATLNFKLWYHTEWLWDFGYVMASTDGGATWIPLHGQHTTTENPHNTGYGSGYTGLSGGGDASVWVDEQISLNAFVGNEVLLRFRVITDDAITQPGMLIDDVSIPEIGYFDDFEAGDGGWQAAGWVWIDNILPQQVWVQTAQKVGRETFVTRWQGPVDEAWGLPLVEHVDQVWIAVSPFAPVTTVPMPYTLNVTVE